MHDARNFYLVSNGAAVFSDIFSYFPRCHTLSHWLRDWLAVTRHERTPHDAMFSSFLFSLLLHTASIESLVQYSLCRLSTVDCRLSTIDDAVL
jgi:hypothetical protein